MRYGLIFGLIVLAVVGRLMPHPDNFTPVMAVALFAGATLPGAVAYALPLAALVASDLLLGFPIDWLSAVVYASFLASVGLGQWLGKRRTWPRTGVATVSGSLLFFAVTNFAAWLGPHGLYAHTVEGLMQSYAMALPFFQNSLAGDLFWSMVLFLLYDLGRASMKQSLRESGHFTLARETRTR